MKRGTLATDREFHRRLVMLEIVGIPGCLLVGLGLFKYFGDNPGAPHPLLGDANVVALILVVGGALLSIKLGLVTRLIMERARHQRTRP